MIVVEEKKSLFRTGITGSDAAAIVGYAPGRTAADVWLSKKHPEASSEPNEKKRDEWAWASRQRQVIADHFAKRNNVELIKVRILPHPSVQWLLATPDRLIKGGKSGLEIENVSEWQRREWGPHETDLIPRHVFIKVTHDMMVTGFKTWNVACSIGGKTPRLYRIYADRELQAMLYTKEKNFYTDFILGDKEPTLDGGKQLEEYMRSKYPKESDRVIEVDPYGDGPVKDSMLKLREARNLKKKYTDQETDQKAFLMSHMKDAVELQWPDESFMIKWKKPNDGVVIHWDAIAKTALEKSTMTPEEIASLKSIHTGVKINKRRFTVEDDSDDGDSD